MNGAKVTKRRKPPMPGTKRKVIARKHKTRNETKTLTISDEKSNAKKTWNIEKVREFAKIRGGKCLSTEYKNLITSLEWKCKNGHVFMRKPQYIYNGKGFCMECKKY